MKTGYSAICRNKSGEIEIVGLGVHAHALKARRHAELTIGGDKTPLAIVPTTDAVAAAKKWRPAAGRLA